MNPPKMPVHIGDLMRDTAHLRALLFGAYMSLMFHHWSTGELPDDDDQLSAIARLSLPEWRKARPILERFFKPGWRHGRIEKDLASAKQSYEARAKAGKEGGKAKAAAKQNPSNATAGPEQPLTTYQSDKIGSAGASKFTEGSKALASVFWKALGFASPLEIPPEFAGVDWRALEWERAGWTADLIDSVARKTGNKPLTYHEKCFATEFARRQAPLPIVEIKPAEKLTVTHGTSPKPGSLIAAIDRQLAALEAEDGADLALPESPLLRISG